MTDISQSFGLLRLPDSIAFGEGCISSAPGTVASLGQRVLVICDPFLANTEAFTTLLDALEGYSVTVTVDTHVVPELPVEVVEEAIQRATEVRPDVIVGFGGGSALDLAKLVALGVAHGTPLNRFYGENQVPGPVVPLVAIPTTSGTGSEVTPVAVLADPDRELKVGISSPHLIPRAAIVDPRLMLGAPAPVTASAGADALVHAIEAFTSRTTRPTWDTQLPVFVGENLLSSTLALESIRLIGSSLRRAVRDGADLEARSRMAYASLLAGMAFGTAGTHLSHAIQYPVGALTHTPHGLGTGMLLPYVMQALLEYDGGRLAQVADALGVAAETIEASAQNAVEEVASIMADIGLPSDLASIGVDASDIPRIVELSLTVRRLVTNSVIEPSAENIERIVLAAFRGDRNELKPLPTAYESETKA
ncbi:alcohol dehydrogenase class IV [Paenarthrobacter nicotinovorans]|uniref:iron-containing alcohol dehydrogenase n=1 Tax=Paenarthrobacter nicotinovorans TaxID=29320 RepID=UPI002784A44D|nr:iron-containing alcohol dehydrogenase [Paenarthrobacter nicotinovorans]MDP9933815.1 alcohol dehydrogenase class IV [Paenarthrobacter nicotinovorans]